MRLNDVDFNVIGVAPELFKGMDQFIEPSFFVPFMMASAIDPNENVTTKRENRTISVKARLKRGISLNAADAEIGAIAKVFGRGPSCH